MLEPIPFVGYMEIEDMNALELADEVESGIYCQEAAAMLRKQEAQIKELQVLLDKTLNNWAKDMEKFKK